MQIIGQILKGQIVLALCTARHAGGDYKEFPYPCSFSTVVRSNFSSALRVYRMLFVVSQGKLLP